MTRDEFLAAVGDLVGARYEDFRFNEDGGTYYVAAMLSGDNAAACLAAANQVLNVAKGKTAFIRIKPEADSQRDFEKDEVVHAGYVRFSFTDEAGDWHYPPLEIEKMSLAGFGGPR